MISHEPNKTKTIAFGVRVYSGYAKELADNGLTADAKIRLCIAPAIGEYDEYLYLETNGDPVLVGWLEDGEFVASDDWEDVRHASEYDWVEESLLAEFLP